MSQAARIAIVLAIATVTACRPPPPAPRPPSPATRPPPPATRHPPPPPAADASLDELVKRPGELEHLDDRSAAALLARPRKRPPATPLLPPAPPVLVPGRPSSGGDALVLADLALARGDAFDAASQYRALLAGAGSSATHAAYARLQLARAYHALGDRDRAVPMLRDLAATGGPLAWAALVELAEVRNAELTASDVLLELRLLAGGRREQLLDHLIHSSPPDQAAVLLLDKALRTHTCGYAFQALLYVPDTPRTQLEGECSVLLEPSPLLDPRLIESMRRTVAFRTRLNVVVDRWDAHADATINGYDRPDPWLEIAEELMSLRPHTVTHVDDATLSSSASSALEVAMTLAAKRPSVDPDFYQRTAAVVNQLAPSDRDRLFRGVPELVPRP